MSQDEPPPGGPRPPEDPKGAPEDSPAAPGSLAPPALLQPPDRIHARFGRSFAAGEILFREGDPAAEAYLLEEGRVRLIKRVRGAERSLMILKPGDLLGESALVPGARCSSTAIAIAEGRALALDHETLQTLLDKNPAVASRIVKQLVRRLRDAEDQIEIMMLSDTQSKVVSALLKLAAQARGAPGGGPVAFTISPMELSTRVGLDVDTVKRTVQQLRESQYLRLSDERLEIPDVDALRRLYGLLGLKDELRGDA